MQLTRRFWTPDISAQNMVPGFNPWPEETSFRWSLPNMPADTKSQRGALAACDASDHAICDTLMIQYSGTTELQVMQKSWNFYYYVSRGQVSDP